MNKLKFIKGFPGYQINEKGEIFSAKHRTSTYVGKKLKSYRHKSGFLAIHLSRNGTQYHCSVANLVYKTFIGEIPKGKVVTWIDGNKLNNNPLNLTLTTIAQLKNDNIKKRT